MSSSFQQLVSRLLSENLTAGGVFGTPNQPIYTPNAPTSGDTYAPGDARNLFGDASTPKKKKKKFVAKMFPKVIKRKFPETML